METTYPHPHSRTSEHTRAAQLLGAVLLGAGAGAAATAVSWQLSGDQRAGVDASIWAALAGALAGSRAGGTSGAAVGALAALALSNPVHRALRGDADPWGGYRGTLRRMTAGARRVLPSPLPVEIDVRAPRVVELVERAGGTD